MSKLPSQIEQIKVAFGRLSQQEQFYVLAGGGAFVLVVLIVAGLAVSSAIDNTKRRIEVKTGQLEEVLASQGDYHARQAERQARLAQLNRSNVKLVSEVERVATQSGVEIRVLTPEESEPSPEGVVESSVNLRAQNLSADRLQEFLSRLEKVPGIVIVRRIKVDRPYRKDTLNLDLTVTTYKRKES